MRPAGSEVVSPIERHAAMTWAQRLKRVFNIDIEVCGRCGGSVRVVACIEDQHIIDRILNASDDFQRPATPATGLYRMWMLRLRAEPNRCINFTAPVAPLLSCSPALCSRWLEIAR